MPRYVILEHDWPEQHWDFMLEMGTVLQTWRFVSPPQLGMSIRAEKSFDHRLQYLDYEGPISGGRGTVTRWDAGSYEVIEEETDRQSFLLYGQRVRGRVDISEHQEIGFVWRWSDE